MKTKHDYNAILQMFCMDEVYTRFDMTKPFLQNGFSWGTNGHFAASVSADIYAAEKRDRVPDPTKIPLAQDMTTYKIPVSVLQDEDLDEELRLYNKWLRDYENFDHGDGSEMFEIESKFPPMCQIVKQHFSYGYISTIRNAFTQLGITEIIYQEPDAALRPYPVPPAIFEGGHLKVLLMPLKDVTRNRKQLYQPKE